MTDSYRAAADRYAKPAYRRCGRSGLYFPAISLGLWQNFGGVDIYETGRAVLRRAFDRGITHFDLANNYGPPPGSAEEMFGRVYAADFRPYRDEMVIATKAGYTMWEGPYGDWGSRKYLLASLDQSLKRLGLDYVDIFYSHRVDPGTPLEETMRALAQAVRQGKALYAGLSNYPPALARQAAAILRDLGTPCLIHQACYSIIERRVEAGLSEMGDELGIGTIAFSPLGQGVLTTKYLGGIPDWSRAARGSTMNPAALSAENLEHIRGLDAVARRRGQSLAQMALAWVLRDPRVTSALIGARNVEQLDDSLDAVANLAFTEEELVSIDRLAPDGSIVVRRT
jgi:L-glyceraldehyde 3-phosphate reductase